MGTLTSSFLEKKRKCGDRLVVEDKLNGGSIKKGRSDKDKI